MTTMRIRKKTLDRATEQAISRAATTGIPLAFDRYEDMSPVCRFGQMGLDCKVCTQGPCRINPFDPSNGTICGRDREGIVAASFLRLVADGAVANASFAGGQAGVSAAIFDGIAAASEGDLPPSQLLQKAIHAAQAGFEALASVGADPAIRETEVGLGAANPDRINILMLGGILPAQAKSIAQQMGSNGKVKLLGMCGGESAGVAIGGNYGSQEALLVTTAIDGVVAGKACVSPAFRALAATQGVPLVDADAFDAAALLEGADTHYRMNAGRTLSARFTPARAVVGFAAGSFAGLSAAQWDSLRNVGLKGIALMGGCNNVVETQDAAIVRQADELLKGDVLVTASGCAAAALAKAGYADPARADSLAGKGLRAFLSALSEATAVAVPAVLAAGTCWQIPTALELARLFSDKLQLSIAAAMPELSRPAGWASALAVAASGVPTYVGPVLPLDGGLQTLSTLNDLLKARGGALLGPGQISSPEAFVNML